MKTLSLRSANRAMTLIEILVVLAAITIAAALFLPMINRPHISSGPTCMSNVRQIDLAFLMYAEDYKGKFSIQTSLTNGGTMEFLDRNQTFPQYQKVSGYIRYVPLFICPRDENRQPATNYQTLADTNISYFLNADISASNPATSIMLGDRNLQTNSRPIRPGTTSLATNMNFGWTRELHASFGIFGFADGHAEICRPTNLNVTVQRQGLATFRLSVP